MLPSASNVAKSVLPSAGVELRTRYGRLIAPAVENDLVIDFLRHYGEWAWLEVELAASRIAHGARVLDGGAFLGSFGLGVAQLRAIDSLCFVEANTQIAPFLVDNAARCCGVPNHVISAMLAPSGTAPAPGFAPIGNLGGAQFGLDWPGTPSISLGPPERSLNLSDIIAGYGPFDFIKLDLEGGELPLLMTEGDFLERFEGDLWIECLANEGALELAALLLAVNRPLWYYAFPAFNPANYAGVRDSLLPFAYESAFFLEGRNAGTGTTGAVPPGCIRKTIRSILDARAALWFTPRFSPPGWDAFGREALVALAMHEMVDEHFDTFLASQGTRWSSPLSRAQAEIARLKQKLASVPPVAT